MERYTWHPLDGSTCFFDVSNPISRVKYTEYVNVHVYDRRSCMTGSLIKFQLKVFTFDVSSHMRHCVTWSTTGLINMLYVSRNSCLLFCLGVYPCRRHRSRWRWKRPSPGINHRVVIIDCSAFAYCDTYWKPSVATADGCWFTEWHFTPFVYWLRGRCIQLELRGLVAVRQVDV